MTARQTSSSPPLRPTLGVAIIFDGLVRLSRITGGRAQRSEAELRGAEGTTVFAFGPDAEWTMEIRAGRVRFRRGGDPSPRATIRMEPTDFLDLLTGRTSYLVAQMAGKIRIEGDGHAAFALGNLVSDLRTNAAKPGLRGRLVRWWLNRACRKVGQTGVEA